MNYYPKPLPKWNDLDSSLKKQINRSKEVWLKNGGDQKKVDEWDRNQVAQGYTLIEAAPAAIHSGDVNFWDAREDRRIRYVERRKRIGKGPPKKGKQSLKTVTECLLTPLRSRKAIANG